MSRIICVGLTKKITLEFVVKERKKCCGISRHIKIKLRRRLSNIMKKKALLFYFTKIYVYSMTNTMPSFYSYKIVLIAHKLSLGIQIKCKISTMFI